MNDSAAFKDKARLAEFLHSLEPENNEVLNELRRRAEADGVPIVRRETESLLRTLMVMLKPARILEIGTATGYSAIVMAMNCEAEIVTVESYDKRVPEALLNIKNAGLSDRISLIHKDAFKALNDGSITGKFDFVFLDAAKGQYAVWLNDILGYMRKGSVLAADNVLQDMTVMESRFMIPRRERTVHERMREFLFRIKHDAHLESAVLPVGDGVSISAVK